MLFAICFNLDQSKILSSGNGLRLHSVTSVWLEPYINPLQYLLKKAFENIVGKGGTLIFSVFSLSHCFLPYKVSKALIIWPKLGQI